MSTVAEFTIPPEELPAGDILVERPEVQIEIERIVPTHESALPFFWVRGSDSETFMEQAAEEAELEEVEQLERVDKGALFRAKWATDTGIIQGIKRLNATIIEATGTSDCWRFQVRTQDREAFKDFREIFEEQGISVHLNRLYSFSELLEGDSRELTPEQRETLILAYRRGYFDNPRRTTQEELGDHFGISRRAISDRLRRGIRNLIVTSLVPSGDRR